MDVLFLFSVFTSFDVELYPLPFVTEPLSVSDISGSVNGSRLRVAYQVRSSWTYGGFNHSLSHILALLWMSWY